MAHYTLDLETRATDPSMVEHAGLEPWRLRQGKAEIMSADLYRPDGTITQIVNNDPKVFHAQLKDLLSELKGHTVWAHNAVFDVAWCIAALQPVRNGPIPQVVNDIHWRDTGLLIKWLINGQIAERSQFSMSLANLVEKFLPEHPKTQEFVEMKRQTFKAGENLEYWLARGSLDVEMTHALAMKYMPKVPVSMREGIKAEFNCIVPIANSWINGFKINESILEENEVYYRTLREQVAKDLNVATTLFSSPKQLQNLLFTEMGLRPHSTTPSGSPSTSKGDLMWIEYDLRLAKDPRADVISKILEAKESATIYSKYVKTAIEALEHTGDGFIYSSPRLFGTYTGRMTYSNTTTHMDFDTDTRKKFKSSIAMHQIPRKARRVRQMIEAPEGHDIGEFDAAGQESRLMAIRSGDERMLEIFQNKLNFHSMTGSAIIGMEYDEFEAARKIEEDENKGAATDEGLYYTEARQRGKLGNLACNFRISGRALSKQAFEKYEVMLDIQTGNHIVKTFNTNYPGVPMYWKDVIRQSKIDGYTEAMGGRRFKLSLWQSEQWGTESSALMFPIQGAGASMKEIAISELHSKVPEFKFALDLHDATFGYMDSSKSKEIFDAAEHCLNNIDYEKYWGFKPSIELPYDGMFGKNFADIK